MAGIQWKQTPNGRNLMTEAELEEMQQNWESSADRSDIFKLAVKLIRHDDMIKLEIYFCLWQDLCLRLLHAVFHSL